MSRESSCHFICMRQNQEDKLVFYYGPTLTNVNLSLSYLLQLNLCDGPSYFFKPANSRIHNIEFDLYAFTFSFYCIARNINYSKIAEEGKSMVLSKRNSYLLYNLFFVEIGIGIIIGY